MNCRNCGYAISSTCVECPNCGSPYGTGVRYCQECGAPSDGASCLCKHCGCELRRTLKDGSLPVASFKEAVKVCFKKYFSGRGRANRVEYWMWWLFVFIATAFIVVGWIMLPILIIPTLSATVRRLHDVDKSGWWMVLGIIPVANLYLIYTLTRKGSEGDNRYGISAEA